MKQLLAIKIFYHIASIIDRHNKAHTDELRVDRGLQTKHWARRSNFGVWGISIADSFYLREGVVHPDLRDGYPNVFVCKLAEEIIDNTIGIRASRSSGEGSIRQSPGRTRASPS